MQNLIVAEEKKESVDEKSKKSLNRRFGFLVILIVILSAVLVFEIVWQFIG